jgi:hypothetical protein
MHCSVAFLHSAAPKKDKPQRAYARFTLVFRDVTEWVSRSEGVHFEHSLIKNYVALSIYSLVSSFIVQSAVNP